MTVGIFSGREGVGKTTQLLALAKAYPPVMWIALELKDMTKVKREISNTFKLCTGYKTYPKDSENAMKVDPRTTLSTVMKCKDMILNERPNTVVVDGISDLRDYATSVWCLKHNEETGEHISTPKYKDWGAWGEINTLVRDILEPLINFALTEDVNLWLTAQMKDDYLNDVKVGYIPDLKAWMSYPVQCLFTLLKDKERIYSLECEKEPSNPSWIVENIEKGKGVLKALLEHELIAKTKEVEEQCAEEKEFMFKYGDGGHTFITATTREKAEEQFTLETRGQYKEYEVFE